MAKKYIDADLLRKEAKRLEKAANKSALGCADSETRKFLEGKDFAYHYVGILIDSLQQEQPCNMAIDLDVIFSNMKRNEAIKQLEHLNKVYGEQPCDTCTNDKGCVTCKDGELWEGKEQSSEDLEKEIKTWIPAHIVGGDKAPWKELKDVVIQWAGIVARHFYILGLKNNIPVTQITLDELAKEEEPVTEGLEEAAEEYSKRVSDGHNYRDLICGFIAGAEWQAERLLKGSPMPEDTVIFQKGIEEGKRLMMEDAVEGYVNYYEDSGGILMAEAQVGCPYHNGDKVKIVIVKEDKK